MIAFALALLLQDDPALPKGPAGWKAEAVARTPAVRHPTVVCAAPDGRLFVGEDPQDMEGPVDGPIGRVLCVHPDGRITVFAEGLGAVFGLLYLDGMVYVHHVPRFTVYRDQDGVGRDPVDLIASTHPDPSRQNRYNTHIPAGFKLAMDGHFYMAVGDKGLPRAEGRDGKAVSLRGGGVLRLRPDGTGLEIFCTGTRNIMDLAIDAEDELFAWDNDDNAKWGARVLHLVEGGDYGYPWDRGRPGTLGALFEGRGIPAGAIACTEDGLPPGFSGDLLFCEWGRSQVVRMKLERDGATWKLLSREPFFSRGASEFRPVGIAAVDRGFVVADWNTATRLRKEEAGRLVGLAFEGPAPSRPAWFLPAATGRPFEAPTRELIEGLSHPARNVRLTAQRRLADRKASRELEAVLARGAAPAKGHAIWALDAIGEGAEAIAAAAKDPDPAVRRQALRQMGLRRTNAQVLRAALRDPDASVRFHAATALGRIGDPSALEPLLEARSERDPAARHAVALALRQLASWDAVGPGLRSADPLVREATLAALRGVHDERVAAHLAEAGGEALLELAAIRRKDPPWDGKSWWGGRPALNPRPLRTVDWAGTARASAALAEALKKNPSPALIRAAGDVETAPALRALFPEADPETRRAILETLARFRGPELEAVAVAALRDPALAAAAAGLVRDPAPLLEGARSDARPAVLVPVLEEIGKRALPDSAAILARHLSHADAGVRRRAVEALGRVGAVRELAPALEDSEVRIDAIAALARTPELRFLDAYLEGLGGRNPDARAACRGAVAAIAREARPLLERRVESLPEPVVAELQRLYASVPESALHRRKVKRPEPPELLEFALANAGDASRGKGLFWDPKILACGRCHVVGGTGGDIGPDLSITGAFYARRDLAESVLYPSRVVAGGYRQTIVRTKSGALHVGIPRRETANDLFLADAEGRLLPIRKAEIEARKFAETSLMPDGLVAGLTPQEFADLVAYLESLKAEE